MMERWDCFCCFRMFQLLDLKGNLCFFRHVPCPSLFFPFLKRFPGCCPRGGRCDRCTSTFGGDLWCLRSKCSRKRFLEHIFCIFLRWYMGNTSSKLWSLCRVAFGWSLMIWKDAVHVDNDGRGNSLEERWESDCTWDCSHIRQRKAGFKGRDMETQQCLSDLLGELQWWFPLDSRLLTQ